MRFLLSSVGTYGDVAPFVALGNALRDRGHDVLLTVNPFFAPLVERSGLEARPVEAWRDALSFTERKAWTRGTQALPLFLRKFVVASLERRFHELKEAVRDWRPDFVGAHVLSLDAAWAAREEGVSWGTVLLSPAPVLTASDPGHFPGLLNLSNAPLWFRRYGKWRLKILARLCTDPPLNRVRKRLGLAPERGNFLERIYDGSVTLGLWSPHYRAPAGDDPPRLEISGFPWFESDFVEGEREELLRFLDGGEPPIVAVLGTGQFRVAGDFFQVVARACERLGRRGLFLTGTEEAVASDLPPSVRSFARAPFSLVLGRASAVVHHGGIGTVAQVMRAGCPSVIVPFAHDQHDNALRLERLGLGERIARRRLSEGGLSGALERLLGDEGVQARCRAMRERLRPEDGAARAAEILEDHALKRAR